MSKCLMTESARFRSEARGKKLILIHVFTNLDIAMQGKKYYTIISAYRYI